MLMTNKLLPVALIAALIGGSVGAFVMYSGNTPATQASTTDSTGYDSAQNVQAQSNPDGIPSDFDTPAEQAAYKSGFVDGFRSAVATASGMQSSAVPVNRPRQTTVYRNATATRRSTPRRVYYNYDQPKGRSFWQKHRDKLTVAMGAGGGAGVGALIGGKKGALIGGLAGAGGSALYTYKLRNRNNRR